MMPKRNAFSGAIAGDAIHPRSRLTSRVRRGSRCGPLVPRKTGQTITLPFLGCFRTDDLLFTFLMK